jgi:FlaA1/EpsC-like NDP-sugar epimerase
MAYSRFDLEAFIRQYVTKRPESLLEADLIANHDLLASRIDGSRVLVIGGAGTIGSNYIKALLRYKPAKLVVVDINENGLTELVRDLRSSQEYHIPTDFITYPFNLGDAVFAKMFRALGPFDIVANFAAHKHVRSEKDVFSIEAMVENNVLRARVLLDLLSESPPKHFFCVSTDKAANPVNVMGATKKLMEEVILAYSQRFPVTTARFANVAFSNGSLPLGFLDRVSKGQPWSCPKGIRRFFVSPIESGQICLMACVLGQTGDIFFPKLDPEVDMIPFDEIAIDLCKALGYQPLICTSEQQAREAADLWRNGSTQDFPIFFFESDTSGEKAFEEFYTEIEDLDLDRFQQLGVVLNAKRATLKEAKQTTQLLSKLLTQDEVSKADIVEALRKYLPNFEHIEKGKHLDQRM